MEVYFTRPGNHCEIIGRLKQDIRHAERRIFIAAYNLSEKEIIKEICNSRVPLVKVILNEKNQSELEKIKAEDINFYKDLNELYESDNTVLFVASVKPYINMHHKFIIVDDILWIGSFNFSFAASAVNWENIIRSSHIVNPYLKEFEKMFLFGKAFNNSIWKFVRIGNSGQLKCNKCSNSVEDPFLHYTIKVICETEVTDLYQDLGEDFNLLSREIVGKTRIVNYQLKCKNKQLSTKTKCTGCNSVFYEKDLSEIIYNEFGNSYEVYGEYEQDEDGEHYTSPRYNDMSKPINEVKSNYKYCLNCLYRKLDNEYWVEDI